MKKLLFGIMAVAMMASCSSEENVGGEPGTGEVKKVSIVVKNAALTRAFGYAGCQQPEVHLHYVERRDY